MMNMDSNAGGDRLRRSIRVPDYVGEIAWYEDGVLYVAQEYVSTARIFSFEADLRRQGLLDRKEAVPLAQIAHLKADGARKSSSQADNRPMDGIMELMRRAVRMSASDIHFHLTDTHCKVEYRVDGYLRTIMEMLPWEARAMVAALYNACDDKNLGEWREREICMGRLANRERLTDGLYAVRFASHPTSDGAIIVLRLLYNSVASRGKSGGVDINALGFRADQVNDLIDMAAAPNGVCAVSGPTGAGKSTTLKYLMQHVHRTYPFFNILTVEDPPEYPIEGAKQIPVLVQDTSDTDPGARSRLYAGVIATALRLDPDILMIGEIRDGASAVAALRAAETGHRLWTTIHANDAWEIINRLLDLLREGGMVDPLPILANAQNMTGAMAQRLLPVLCPHCSLPLIGNEDGIGGISGKTYMELLSAVPDFDTRAPGIRLRGDGCDHCVPHFAGRPEQQKADGGAGIVGRTLVAEVIRLDQDLLDIVRSSGIPDARLEWMRRGSKTLSDHAIEKVLAGHVAPDAAREFTGPLVSSRQILMGKGVQ